MADDGKNVLPVLMESFMQPLVSVIMPCFNSEQYVSQSIESVIAQSYRNWELIVTDDCSSDSSAEIVEDYCKKDSRIRLYKMPEHSGIASTRNNSIDHAVGRFLAFLDSDDMWTCNKLLRQIEYMISNGVGLSYAEYELVGHDGVAINKIVKTAGIVDYNKYLRNTIIGCGTVVVDRDLVGNIIMPIVDTSEDMAAWLKIMKMGCNAYPINEVLLKYRITRNSASSNKFKAACDVWRVYRDIEKLSMVKSVFCFVGYIFNAVKKRL